MNMIAIDLDRLREREGADRPRGMANRCIKQAIRPSPTVGEPRFAILPATDWDQLAGGQTLRARRRRRCRSCHSHNRVDEREAPTRPSCLACVEKHLGAALVLLTETRVGYAYRLRAIGHLFEAEDESQEWPDLRAARKAYQAEGALPDWDTLISCDCEASTTIGLWGSKSKANGTTDCIFTLQPPCDVQPEDDQPVKGP